MCPAAMRPVTDWRICAVAQPSSSDTTMFFAAALADRNRRGSAMERMMAAKRAVRAREEAGWTRRRKSCARGGICTEGTYGAAPGEEA